MKHVIEILAIILIVIIWLLPAIASGSFLWFLLINFSNHFIHYILITFMAVWFFGWTYAGLSEGYRYFTKRKTDSITRKVYHHQRRLKYLELLRSIRFHYNQLGITAFGSIILLWLFLVNPETFNIFTIIFPLGFVYNFLKIKKLKLLKIIEFPSK